MRSTHTPMRSAGKRRVAEAPTVVSFNVSSSPMVHMERALSRVRVREGLVQGWGLKGEGFRARVRVNS